MSDERVPSPADHVTGHKLAEKLVYPLALTDVKIVLEGLDAQGNVLRIRTAGVLEVAKPEHLALVTVQPLEEVDTRYRLAAPETNHLVLVAQMLGDDEGVVYLVEQLQEREL